MTYTAIGKQVLHDGSKHVADAATPAYATAIAAALSATAVDRGVSSPVMREIRDDTDPVQQPDILRTLRGDDGRLDIFRGMYRLGYLDADDQLWLIGDDGFAHDAGETVDRSKIADAMQRHGK